MNAKDKAKELFLKYRPIIAGKQFLTGLVLMSEAKELTKQCALVAVDEMLKHDEKIIVSHKTSAYKSFEDFNQNLKHIQNELDSYVLSRYSYWQEVKQEIEKL